MEHSLWMDELWFRNMHEVAYGKLIKLILEEIMLFFLKYFVYYLK